MTLTQVEIEAYENFAKWTSLLGNVKRDGLKFLVGIFSSYLVLQKEKTVTGPALTRKVHLSPRQRVFFVEWPGLDSRLN